MPEHTTILSGKKFNITLDRLCYQLIENHGNFQDSALIGLQPRGVFLAQAMVDRLTQIVPSGKVPYGILDTTFHRDDFRTHKGPMVPSSMKMDIVVENKKIIFVDDVLYTGRTIRAGLDALLDFGRPASVELLVLVDRRYSRQLPIEPNYVGLQVDTRASQRVKVNWKAAGEEEDSVWLNSEMGG
jgi:pyrimidine operon attenuation protein/uracil phosphoribosyltransferase